MALHYVWLSANPDLQPYLRRAREERAAAVYATWKAVTGAIAAAFGALAETIRRARRAQRTLDALSGLSDRQLADIGLTRGEIRAVAHAAAEQTPESHFSLADLRRAEAAETRRVRAAPRPAPWAARAGNSRQSAPRRKAA